MKTPKLLESHLVLKGFANVYKEKLQIGEERPYDYYVLSTKPAAVVILALDSQGRWIVNEEYRHPVKEILLSCPGGFIDEGESTLEAAKRELLEETGYSAESYELMGSAYPYPGISTQNTFYVLAKGARKIAQPHLDASEVLKAIEMPFEEIREEIKRGRKIDGTLLTALAFYQLHCPAAT